ncbi:hypothetical protein CEUSTIGMA_g7136.t1 [Chlamydomonas eustigma]|uniref:RWD domain-containing protein n=1 Tax=Chlamydomonas eustigma TaxID=1157962 RepID=A0A250X9D2_9CHLO|nr:hypothetical protein CEUSTIGMA_g7136.t1 [Chlamydomonas eustigma]|eukprot:GAX79695.1 hypothetical protein CEUSTIGMA_g7136.t1 [Chlamydomonas eustigma]
MTDYASEQAMEIEALEAILMDDLQIYSGMLPDGWHSVGETYKVLIDPTEEGDEPPPPEDEKLAELLFAHTATYPDEAPCLRLRAVRGLSDADIHAGTAYLLEQVQENIGMAMVFTLVGAAKEWLRTKAGSSAKEDPVADRKKAEAEEEARRAAARAHGTPVTLASFMAWKAKFDSELALKKVSISEESKDDRGGRLTGKQYFLKNSNMADDSYEAGAISDGEDEEDMEEEEEDMLDDEEDIDYDDDDDEGMLEMYDGGKEGS